MPPDSTTFFQLLLDPQQWTPATIFTAIGAVAAVAAAWFAYLPYHQQRRTQKLLEKSFGSELYTPEVIATSTSDHWRLPSLQERRSLMEREKNGDLHIDRVFDSEQTRIWTEDNESAERVWAVNFSIGVCYRYFVGNVSYVRAVS